jgi:hypothetical protein
MKAKLTAPLMYRYQRDTVFTEFPNTLHVDFYDDSVRIESWLTANYGIYYDNLNKVFLRDSVTVINNEGDTYELPNFGGIRTCKNFIQISHPGSTERINIFTAEMVLMHRRI